MGKVKKKMNLGVLGMNPYGSNMVPQSCLDPMKALLGLFGFSIIIREI
jgi:hypothetical protein